MSTLRFVHLSDIHFGQNRNGSVVFHKDVREELLKNCAEMRARLGAATGVLVTGDIAFAGKKNEYRDASAWLAQVTEVLGCKRTDVSVIPGNHDIDFDEIGYSTRVAHEDLRNRPAEEVEGVLEEIAEGAEDANPLLPKLKAYREFAEVYGCDFESILRPVWANRFSLGGESKLCFLGLNSVQVSDRNDNARRGTMLLGKNQYIFQREDDVAHVVMVHHPLDWFKDKVEASRYITSRASVVMAGHEHQPAIEKISNETGAERLLISSGATNPPETDYKYTYNWLEFSQREVGGGQKLVVTVYPNVWVREQTRFAPDRARLNGSESKEFELDCQAFKPRAPGRRTEGVRPIRTAVESRNPVNNSAMISSEDERFARLRYFFWRFLDWRQRLGVLSGLDVLPRTADRPVPQTMERLALEMARAQKKLAMLWDAVMQLVPQGEREKNPFKLGEE
ncbi:MAG: metallophosphoesterase [Limisphaerales bacterium]